MSEWQLRLRWTQGETVFFVGSGLFGLVALILIGQMNGTTAEEWDTALFWRVVLPIAEGSAFLGGVLFPGHSWRWGLAPWWMQHVYMLWQHGPGNIWPIAIIFWALLLLPFVGLARLGASIYRAARKGLASQQGVEPPNPRLKTDVENALLGGSLIRHGLAA
jgi:hypothetical protein